jgi:hypothetical protein
MGKMENLKDNKSPLSNISKENPFRVPNHYFDDFSARLQSRIEAEKSIVPDQPNRFIRILKPALGLAASFALIFLLVYWPVKTFTPNQSAENQTEESNFTYMDYINSLYDAGNDFSLYASEEESNGTSVTDEDIADYIPSQYSEFALYAGIYAESYNE